MPPIIQADNLTLAYNSETILSDLKFTINEGDLVFITGMSGSGKSTLLKTFYGAIAPKVGSLVVNGYPLHNIRGKINQLRQTLGMIFQDYKLIKEWDIQKNIALPMIIGGYSKEITDTQVDKLLSHVKMNHRKDRIPEELSGGEQQRGGVARALAHNPHIILADEPTGNLDDFSTEIVMDLFLKVHDMGKTVIIVTHKMPENLNVKYRHLHLEDREIHEYN